MVKNRNDLLGVKWVWKLTGLGDSKRIRDIRKKIVPEKELAMLRDYWYEEASNPKTTWTRLKRVAICLTFAETGIRSIGAENLRIEDMDFERNRVNIEFTKKAKTRIIPVDGKYMAIMRKYVDAREARIIENDWKAELLEPSAPLFFQEAGTFGQPTIAKLLSQTIGKESRKVVGKMYRSHAFRHAKATQLLREGFSEKQVQDYMGHENFATTSIYVHLTADDLDKAYRTRNGHGAIDMNEKKETDASNPIEVAVDALTKQLIIGALTADQYAAAVKALKQ
jgi:site-specific recombinase XerD